uniref:Succinate dehydrogenase subunit 3 n=1 Tax=Palpitomonas bilix TaxID=652834 RepID=A0A1E1GHN6_9EUKA|nr:succinate dehydrogenase subunit 3 [Palpitomonas bilix]YP_009317269.1 succinate dehydrogenase subunit 3 [Palpitomonas bilix]BAV82384.1 succinate dehydrogenase subunit 3 [Palpitomonas bilix]BAV82437.1 succinate dehydrogenase subunit 3 [Palpitomonas bilix]
MKKNRPLSPHLTIYKPQLTSMLSIFHRVSGVLLALVLLFGSFFIYILNIFSSYFFVYNFLTFLNIDFINFLIVSLFVFFVLLFHYHFLNGLRHWYWDFGFGFNLKSVYFTGSLVILGSIVLSLVVLNFVF